jgi:IS30 family transposase
MTYTHLTMKELCWIEHYYECATPVKTIAGKLSRSLQTIYNVVNRLKAGCSIQDYYDNYKANKKKCGRKKEVLTLDELDYIWEKTKLGWAPDIIVNVDGSPLTISAKTLYRRFQDDHRLNIAVLPMQGKRKPNGYIEKRGKDSFCLTIHERDKLFPNLGQEVGHFEGDTIVGKNHQSRVITLAGRQFKSIITLKPQGNDATSVAKCLDEWLCVMPKHTIKSITFDRGKEFSKWKMLCNKHDIFIFFADPGTPSQRGLNENSNGLLRRDGLPKQTDFNDLTEEEIQTVAQFRNNIPRKSLAYKSPTEKLIEWIRSGSPSILA